MKLIIDIPDNEYKYTCERTLHDRTMWDDAIRNGIPLDDVKAEIKELFKTPARYMPNYDAYSQCLEIIDKHIRKAESEEE